jgi:hypothetical protein
VDLANATDLPVTKVNAWLQPEESAGVSRGDLSRITYGLTFGYNERTGPKSAENAEEILIEFLEAVNLGPSDRDFETDIAWERMRSRKTLRVGWVEAAPLLEPMPARGAVIGAAAKITQDISELLGVVVQWVKEDWCTLSDAVMSRRVDLFAPVLMRGPSLLLEFGLSKQIPGSYGHVRVVAHEASYRSMGTERLTAEQLTLNCIEGEVGSRVCSSMMKGEVTPQVERHRSLLRASNYILSRPYDEGTKRLQCLVADELICREFLVSNPDFSLLGGESGIRPLSFPRVFAMHPKEPRLAETINLCIDILPESGLLRDFSTGDANDNAAILEYQSQSGSELKR